MSLRQAPSLIDVARLAGVSTATAGRALGGYGSVRDGTRERVAAAAAELGYRTNDLARSMITGSTRLIGVVVPDVTNPFFASALRGIADAAQSNGFDVLLANSDRDVVAEARAVHVMASKRVDGVVVAAADPQRGGHLVELVDRGTPVVLLDRVARGLEGVSSVMIDHEGAMHAAVEHLLGLGHRRIGILTQASRASAAGGGAGGGVGTAAASGGRVAAERGAATSFAGAGSGAAVAAGAVAAAAEPPVAGAMAGAAGAGGRAGAGSGAAAIRGPGPSGAAVATGPLTAGRDAGSVPVGDAGGARGAETGVEGSASPTGGGALRGEANAIGPAAALPSQLRLLAYLDALREAGIEAQSSWMASAPYDREAACAAARALLERRDRPSALVCTDSVLAAGAYQAAQELGLRVPDEVSLLGFDDDAWTTLVRPQLSVVQQPSYELGVAGARRLLDLVNGTRSGASADGAAGDFAAGGDAAGGAGQAAAAAGEGGRRQPGASLRLPAVVVPRASTGAPPRSA